MVKTAVGGDSPKRRVTYADMMVEKVKPSGAYRISHFQDGYLNSRHYMGYTKKQAMKQHKDHYEGGGQ